MTLLASTQASRAVFVGPGRPAAPDSPLWQAELALHYGGGDAGGPARPVVFKRLGLTAVAERTDTDRLARPKVDFRTPTLLQAWVRSTDDATLTLRLGDGPSGSAGLLRDAPAVDADPRTPVLVAPAGGIWPSQEDQADTDPPVPALTLPPFALVEGRLPVRIALANAASLTRLLNVDAGASTVLGGLRVTLDGPPRARVWPVELTPRGLEFEADLPDPSADFTAAAPVTAPMSVIVCLELDADGTPQLRLSGARRQSVVDAMEANLARAFRRLQLDRTPLGLRFDVRPTVPVLRWPLHFDGKGWHLADSLAAGGGFREWTVRLDVATLDARLLTGTPSAPAVAGVPLTSATLRRRTDSLTLELNPDRPDPAIELVFDRPADPADPAWRAADPRVDGAVTIDLDVPAARLLPAAVDARALPPGAPLPSLFLPVQDGWLQWPLPPAVATDLPPPPDPVVRYALQGRLRSTAPALRRTVTVDAAAHCTVAMTWRWPATTPGPAIASRLTVRLWQPAGTLEGYLSAATASPDADDALPSLAAGAAALIDLPITFGRTRSAGRWWAATFASTGSPPTWSLEVAGAPATAPALAWLRDPRFCLATLLPLTRAALGGTRPSATRGLLPVRLRLTEAGDLLRLTDAGPAAPPALSYAGPTAWGVPSGASSELLCTQMPTLPGVEFRPFWPDAGGGREPLAVNRWAWQARLRYGLPALDELYGSAQLPPPPPAEDAPPPPVITALDLPRLQAAWRASADRVGLSWATARHLCGDWIDVGTSQPIDVSGLAAPYPWHTALTVHMQVTGPSEFADGAAVGSYTLGGSTHVAGRALPGLGKEGEGVRFRLTGAPGPHLELAPPVDATGAPAATFELLGLAAPTWLDDGLQRDAAGLAIAGRFGEGGSALVRQAHMAAHPPGFGWLTLKAPLRLRLPDAAGAASTTLFAKFFVRDLPVTSLKGAGDWRHAFDGAHNPCESSVGADDAGFGADTYGDALHEWRLFGADEAAGLRDAALEIGPLAFTPLRLWSLELYESVDGQEAVTALQVIGRLRLASRRGAWDAEAKRGPFGPERPYEPGELFVLSWNGAGVPTLAGASTLPSAKPLLAAAAPDVADGLVTLQLETSVATGNATPDAVAMPVRLRIEPRTGGRAELQARLLGAERRLTGQVNVFERNGITCTFDAPASVDLAGPIAQAGKITVAVTATVENDGRIGWSAGLHVELVFQMRTANGVPIFVTTPKGWQWLNLTGETTSSSVSHATGAVVVGVDSGALTGAEPLHGLRAAGFALTGSVAVLFDTDDGWPKASPAAPLHLDLEGVAPADAVGAIPLRISHRCRGPGDGEHRLTVSMDVRRESLVRWPTAVAVSADTQSTDTGNNTRWRPWSRTVSISKPTDDLPLLTHEVVLRLREQALGLPQLGRLGAAPGAGAADTRPVGIAGEWRLLAPVTHLLSAANGMKPLAWASLDHVVMQPASRLAAAPTFSVYAARFVHGNYRGVKESGMPHPGVAAAGVGQSGLADGALLPLLSGWADIHTPVLVGGATMAFKAAGGDVDGPPDGRGVVVPWLAALEPVVPSGQLDQSPAEGTNVWRFAAVDAVAGTAAFRLQRQPTEVTLSTQTPGSEVLRRLLDAGPGADRGAGAAVASTSESDALVAQAPVSQSYFERLDGGTGAAIGTARQAPFFGPALCVLGWLWETTADPGKAQLRTVAARTVVARAAPRRDAVVVRVLDTTRAVTAKASNDWVAVDLVVLGREGGCATLPNPLMLPCNGTGLDGLLAGGQRADVCGLARRAQADPALLLARAAGGTGAWRALHLATPGTDLEPADALVPSAALAPSAALGWPSEERLDQLHALAPNASHDIPRVAPGAGLAGRRQGLGFPAWAPGAGSESPSALCVWLASHVVYDRPGGMTFRGPVARHLALLPTRLRVPCEPVVRAALDRVVVAGPSERAALPICPANLEYTSVGHRAGELHAWTAALVVPAERTPFDDERPEYGRPASSTPVIARQLRTPRAPLLPDERYADTASLDPGLARRRRTFVSAADRRGADRLAPWQVVDGYATVVRSRTVDGIDHRYRLRLVDADGKLFTLTRGWDGLIHLQIRVASTGAPAGSPPLSDMARLGLVPRDDAPVTAGLRIGSSLLPFESWACLPSDSRKTVSVTLKMAGLQVAALAGALDRWNGNTPVAFELGAGPAPGAQAAASQTLAGAESMAIGPGPILAIRLPMTLDLDSRSALRVTVRTLVFGDPSHDRQLGSPVRRSDPVLLGSNRRMVLITDRDAYALADPVHLLVEIQNETGKVTLEVGLQPKSRPDGEPRPVRPLRLPGTAGTFPLNRVITLDPKALREQDGSEAQIEAADRLQLTVSAAGSPARQCTLMLPFTDRPTVPAAPAVYSLVGASPGVQRTELPQHACGPLPDRIEYPDLAADLAAGFVRRRGLFIWSWNTVGDAPARVSLVKVDRSSSMQVPTTAQDFTRF